MISPPCIPQEIRGSGYHPEDIGPLHDRPITYKQWQLGQNLREIMLGAWPSVLSSLRPMAAPTFAGWKDLVAVRWGEALDRQPYAEPDATGHP